MTEERMSGRGLALFAVLYALAALYETKDAVARVQHVTNPVTLAQTLCFAAALWTLLRPGSANRFAAFCAVHGFTVLVLMPRIPNHWVLDLAVDASFVAAWLRARTASGAVSADTLYRSAAPVVRWCVLALYFWAVFHKLNVDFFDRDLSCGAMQLFRLQQLFPFLPVDAWAREAVIWGTLAAEIAIPLLLVLRRTRLLGVAVATGFHFTLGFLYLGFSATLFAYFSLFVPAAALAQLPDGAALRRRLGAGVLAFAGVYALLIAVAETRLALHGVLWLAYGSAWLAVLLPLLARGVAGGEPGLLRLPHPALGLIPLLLFANGASPYLGLKNIQSFAMFSNLRLEGGASNHLLVPASWQVSDNQRDLVRILDSSDAVLRELTEARRYIHFFSTTVHPTGHPALDPAPPTWRLPWVSLRARVAHYAAEGRTGLSLRYERNGRTLEVQNAERDPELSGMSWLARKLLLLRAVPDGDRGLCMW